MARMGIAGLAMAAAVTTMAGIGLAKAAPVPLTRKELARVDPPMPDLLPAILPAAVTSQIDTMAEKRRLSRLPSNQRLIMDAAEAKRERRRLRNLAWATSGGDATWA